MGLCTRTTKDPLLSKLLELRVVPFSIARKESPLGSVYLIATNGGEISAQLEWQLHNVITMPFVVEPIEITTPEGQELSQISTSKLNTHTALGVIGRMMPTMSTDGKAKLKAALKHAGAASCSLRLVEPSIQRLKADELQMTLSEATFSSGFKASLGGMTPYVCIGAWAAKTLEVVTVDSSDVSLDLLAELEAVLKGEANVLVKLVAGDNNRKKFESQERLFYGAELMRLDQDSEGGLRLAPYRPVGVLANANKVWAISPDEIWDADDTAWIDLTPGRYPDPDQS